MIDISTFTQEQQWGLQFVTQRYNETIEEENQLTVEEYTENMLKQASNSYYQQLIEFKTQNALAMFNALPAEQQEALVAQLQIPDVIKTK